MKRILGIALTLCMALSLFTDSANAATPKPGAVVVSPQILMVDGVVKNAQKYNIDGANYFKLRDLAYLLNGTGSQFGVGWDGATGTVTITTGEAYTPVGGELETGADMSASTVPSAQTIKINGETRSDLYVYNIGGANFFKLRDLGTALGFEVDYDATKNAATVTTKGSAPVAQDNVAKIDNTSYETLAAAVAAATKGQTITLQKDALETVTIPSEKWIKLDLNGHKIGDAVVNGVLAITGNGAMDINEKLVVSGELQVRGSLKIGGAGALDLKGIVFVFNGNDDIDLDISEMGGLNLEGGMLLLEKGAKLKSHGWNGEPFKSVQGVDNYEDSTVEPATYDASSKIYSYGSAPAAQSGEKDHSGIASEYTLKTVSGNMTVEYLGNYQYKFTPTDGSKFAHVEGAKCEYIHETSDSKGGIGGHGTGPIVAIEDGYIIMDHSRGHASGEKEIMDREVAALKDHGEFTITYNGVTYKCTTQGIK